MFWMLEIALAIALIALFLGLIVGLIEWMSDDPVAQQRDKDWRDRNG